MIIILFVILGCSFWLLVGVLILFGWFVLVGVVWVEFLCVCNFEYVCVVWVFGVSDCKIMFCYILFNVMVVMLIMLFFVVIGMISLLVVLDYFGYGLLISVLLLGELVL